MLQLSEYSISAMVINEGGRNGWGGVSRKNQVTQQDGHTESDGDEKLYHVVEQRLFFCERSVFQTYTKLDGVGPVDN